MKFAGRLAKAGLCLHLSLSIASHASAESQPANVEPSSSDIRQAKTLAAYCRGSSMQQIACLGFVTGFVAGSETSWAEIGRTTRHLSNPTEYEDVRYFCLPQTFTSKDLIREFLAIYDRDDDLKKEESRLLLVIALRRNWPCSGS